MKDGIKKVQRLFCPLTNSVPSDDGHVFIIELTSRETICRENKPGFFNILSHCFSHIKSCLMALDVLKQQRIMMMSVMSEDTDIMKQEMQTRQTQKPLNCNTRTFFLSCLNINDEIVQQMLLILLCYVSWSYISTKYIFARQRFVPVSSPRPQAFERGPESFNTPEEWSLSLIDFVIPPFESRREERGGRREAPTHHRSGLASPAGRLLFIAMILTLTAPAH